MAGGVDHSYFVRSQFELHAVCSQFVRGGAGQRGAHELAQVAAVVGQHVGVGGVDQDGAAQGLLEIGVAADVVAVAVGVDDVEHFEPALADIVREHLGWCRGIDQQRVAGVVVPEQPAVGAVFRQQDVSFNL